MESDEFDEIEELTEDEIQQLQKFSKFKDAASKALENAQFDVEIKFQCPLCCGVAHAGKSSYNGHKHASCPQCNIAFRE